MDIKNLIEKILESTPQASKPYFLFTLEDTNAKQREYAVNCYGERVAHCDYFGLSMETHIEIGVDAAVAFLFDCDTHLWELVKYDVDGMRVDGWTDFWRITLRR